MLSNFLVNFRLSLLISKTIITECVLFADKVCERGSVALVHCLAGISRSPTLAIAYMMRRNNWTSEQAYRLVSVPVSINLA